MTSDKVALLIESLASGVDLFSASDENEMTNEMALVMDPVDES